MGTTARNIIDAAVDVGAEVQTNSQLLKKAVDDAERQAASDAAKAAAGDGLLTTDVAPTAPFVESERAPVSWHVISHPDGIHAINNVTGRSFIGAMATFNKLMKG